MTKRIAQVEDCLFLIKNDEDDLVQKDLSRGHYWETCQLHLTFRVIDRFPIKNVLIIGGHIGSIAIPIAKKVQKYGGHLDVFEPSPSNCDHFRENIKLNNLDNINLHEKAVGNKDDFCYISDVVTDKSKNHHLWTQNDLNNNIRGGSWNNNTLLKVPMVTLDKFFATELKDYDLVLIDVEGMETEIFQGGYKFLQKNQPFIVCELWGNEKRKLEKMEFTREQMIQVIQNKFNVLFMHVINTLNSNKPKIGCMN
jgi:FkbM family methyltransferase